MSEEISREETKVKTFDVLRFIADNAGLSIYEAIEKAYNMGLSEQEPKMGHWIIIDDCERFIAKCSECGRIEDSRMINKYPYCHCGAKMEKQG